MGLARRSVCRIKCLLPLPPLSLWRQNFAFPTKEKHARITLGESGKGEIF